MGVREEEEFKPGNDFILFQKLSGRILRFELNVRSALNCISFEMYICLAL